MPAVTDLEEEVDGLSTEEMEILREEALGNLYFFAKGILGFKDINTLFHARFCAFLQDCEKKRRLALAPRGHLKSSIGITADSARLALKDPANARILLISETSSIAKKSLGQIKNHFENNRVLRSLFADRIPERFSGPGVLWRDDSAKLPANLWKDPTWQALGIGGAVIGSHFTRIKADDIIGFEAIRSGAKMEEAKEFIANIEPLLDTPVSDIIDFTGTRWSRNDVYGKIMEDYRNTLGVFTMGPVVKDSEGNDRIFEAKYSWEKYQEIQQINPAQWAAQFENDPLTSLNSDFPIESLRSFRFTEDGEGVLLESGKRWALPELDRCLTADPNSGSVTAPDCAAISVQGVSPDSEVVTLESWGKRTSPSDFVDQIYNLARRWRVRVVGIEKAGQQNTIHYFKLKAEQENYHVHVEELKPRGRHKEDRCRAALEPLIRSGLLHVLPSQRALRKQIAEFPDCLLWDEIDALSYGPEVWRKGERQEVAEKRQGVIKKLLAMRSAVTGY